MRNAVAVLLLNSMCILAPHAQGQGATRQGARVIQRDLELERAVSMRYSEITPSLQPEARAKLALASLAVRKQITSSSEYDPYEIAHTQVDRRFTRLSSQQADLLTFYVLADVARQGKLEIQNAKEESRDKLDSMSEMGDMESLRLQMAMDRLSKLMSTLSNLLKKASETASGITQNIK